MDFLIYIDTTRMGMSILRVHFKESQIQFFQIMIYLSQETFFILANNGKPDKMLLFVVFYLDLLYLPNYVFNSWPTSVVC